MSFEPFHLIFFLIWGFFLYKALFRRRKRPPVNMPPDIPQEEKSVPPSAADTDGEYDYQALRKKILTTWQAGRGKRAGSAGRNGKAGLS